MSRRLRFPRFRKPFSARRSRAHMHDVQEGMQRAGAPTDMAGVRAKSSRHRKSTADKWNQ